MIVIRSADSWPANHHNHAVNSSLLIYPVLVPLLFWAAYHYYHDRQQPEPLGNLLICIVLGATAAYANRYMYLGLDQIGLRYDASALAKDNLAGLFLYSVLVIGFGEELAKMLPFLIIVLRFRAFDEPIDGIIYGSFVALGFATVENLHYASFLPPGEVIARSFAGPLVHIVFASIWAYPIGMAQINDRSVGLQAAKWLAVSAIVHGVYDFLVLGFGKRLLLPAALVVVSLWIWRLFLIRRLQAAAANEH